MHKPVTFGLVLVLAAVAACGDSKSDSSTFGNTSSGTAGKGGGATAGSAGSGTAGSGTGGTSSGKGGSAGTGIVATGGNGTGAGSGSCTTDPNVDQDKDGWTGAQGDCNDCDPNVNPGAMDVVNYAQAGGGAGGAGGGGTKTPLPDDQQVDEDCDGKARLPADDVTCDGALAIDSNDPFDAAKAMELCQKAEENPTDPKMKKWGVTKAAFAAISGAPFTPKPPSVGKPELSYGIVPNFGTPTKPQGGKSMFVISAGEARAPGQKSYDAGSVCSWDKGYASAYPTGFPKQGTCGTTGDPHDGAALDMNIRVPTNAKTMKFNFRFFSCEFPQYTCSVFNDVFAALMFPDPLPMGDPMSPNIAFENTASGKKNVIGVNNESFFTACSGKPVSGTYPNCKGDADLKGSGFEGHAASAWLESQVPVKPGTIVTLRLAIWDSADGILDSTAVVDNFQFLAEEGTGVGTVIVPDPHLATPPAWNERRARSHGGWRSGSPFCFPSSRSRRRPRCRPMHRRSSRRRGARWRSSRSSRPCRTRAGPPSTIACAIASSPSSRRSGCRRSCRGRRARTVTRSTTWWRAARARAPAAAR